MAYITETRFLTCSSSSSHLKYFALIHARAQDLFKE